MWYQTKVSYLKQAENGSIFKKSEIHLLQSVSFIDAETRLQSILEEYIPEYELKACKQSNANDVIIDESKDFFYALKVVYNSADADTGKEKKITENYLVQSDSITEAIEKVTVRMEGTVMPWEITTVSKTNIVDVFPYVDEA